MYTRQQRQSYSKIADKVSEEAAVSNARSPLLRRQLVVQTNNSLTSLADKVAVLVW